MKNRRQVSPKCRLSPAAGCYFEPCFCSKTQWHVSVGFWPPCWSPSGWAPTWCLHTLQISINLFCISLHTCTLLKKNCCDLNLGKELCIFTFFLFSVSGLYLWNIFLFLFQSILNGVILKTSNKKKKTKILITCVYFIFVVRNWNFDNKEVGDNTTRQWKHSKWNCLCDANRVPKVQDKLNLH